MNALLRRIAEWRGRSKAAQVVVFDGGAEVERTRSFFRGALFGGALATGLFIISAPSHQDSVLLQEIEARNERVREANERLGQALAVADVCLNTAQNMERTLASYQSFLGGRPAPGLADLTPRPASR